MSTAPIPHPTRLWFNLDYTSGVYDAATDEVEWWLPILGPTATAALKFAARVAGAHRYPQWWDAADLARSLGLGGNVAKLHAALNRLVRFGVAEWTAPDTLVVRAQLPSIPERYIIDRCPTVMFTASCWLPDPTGNLAPTSPCPDLLPRVVDRHPG